LSTRCKLRALQLSINIARSGWTAERGRLTELLSSRSPLENVALES